MIDKMSEAVLILVVYLAFVVIIAYALWKEYKK